MNRAHASAGRASAAGSRSWGLEICARASARARSTRVSARPRGVRALAGVRACGCVQQGPPVRSPTRVPLPGESALLHCREKNPVFHCRVKVSACIAAARNFAAGRNRAVSPPQKTIHFAAARAAALFPALHAPDSALAADEAATNTPAAPAVKRFKFRLQARILSES